VYEGLVTLTSDRVILYTVVHPSSLKSLKSKKRFVNGRTYARMYGLLRPALLGRLCRRVDLITKCICLVILYGTASSIRNFLGYQSQSNHLLDHFDIRAYTSTLSVYE